MSRHPTLSVVMPNYNHARYLPRAIEAIAEQTRPPDEFLILDDASTDDSVGIIESYAARYPFIRFVRNEQNQGAIAAHARLFELASGDYLHAAAADDDRLPTFFERAMELVEKHPRAGLVFGRVRVVNEHDEELGTIDVRRWQESLYAPPDAFLRDYLEGELASHAASPATIYRRQAFAEVGFYRPELGSWADSFATRAIGVKYGACYVPETFAVWRKLSGSYSDAGRTAPRRTLDMIARAARLMRSDEFRDRFPERYVREWERQYRRLVIWNYWLGDDAAGTRRPSFFMRNLRRLPRTPASLALAFYRGDISLYPETKTAVKMKSGN